MTIATDMLNAYLSAEAALLQGKEVRLGDKTYRSEDLDKIRDGRREWESRVAAEKSRAAGVSTLGGMSISVGRCK